MAKDLMFKLRLDGLDRDRLDAIADHYSAPAATVLRILIKKEFDLLRGGGDASAISTSVREPSPPSERTTPVREAYAAVAERVKSPSSKSALKSAKKAPRPR